MLQIGSSLFALLMKHVISLFCTLVVYNTGLEVGDILSQILLYFLVQIYERVQILDLALSEPLTFFLFR